jgi:homoserine O-acetyltransferase
MICDQNADDEETMRRHIGSCIFYTAILALTIVHTTLAQGEQKFAELGDFKLESGDSIRGCRIGYRTFGQLNQAKSNGVLFPTWFSGTTEMLVSNVSRDGLVDPADSFVILVDALGNGVSSSPSNSPSQRGAAFPRITIRDMVNAEHLLVTKVFGINHLRAVMGISMGGMQTFQWMVSYPDFMDLALPIVGTTQQTAYDLLLWQTELQVVENAARCGGDALPLIARIQALNLYTPNYRNAHTGAAQFEQFIAGEEKNLKPVFNGDNWSAQLRAMMAHDIAGSFNGSLAAAADSVRARTLVVVARQDHMVNPQPSVAFARLIRAEVIEVAGDCGHNFAACENEKIGPRTRRFLAQ